MGIYSQTLKAEVRGDIGVWEVWERVGRNGIRGQGGQLTTDY